MSSRQAVVLASRVLCVYLIFWVVSNLIDLPADIFALHKHWSDLASGPDISYERYLFRYDSLRVEALILKSALELLFAGVFYRCGPRISQFLIVGVVKHNSADVDPTA
jgi:hypothetical protein